MSKDKRNYTPHGGEHLISAEGKYGGTGTGYEKKGNKIWPAPCVYEQMDKIIVRENGLQAYIAAMNKYIVEQFRAISEDKKNWWDAAYRAYGLDPNDSHVWHINDRCIETKEPENIPAPPSPSHKESNNE